MNDLRERHLRGRLQWSTTRRLSRIHLSQLVLGNASLFTLEGLEGRGLRTVIRFFGWSVTHQNLDESPRNPKQKTYQGKKTSCTEHCYVWHIISHAERTTVFRYTSPERFDPPPPNWPKGGELERGSKTYVQPPLLSRTNREWFGVGYETQPLPANLTSSRAFEMLNHVYVVSKDLALWNRW